MQNNQYRQLSHDEAIEKFDDIFENGKYYIPILVEKDKIAVIMSMSRETYVDSTFLDDRTVSTDEVNYIIPLDSLRKLYNNSNIKTRPLNYIFHTAFCGSTLMCRALDKIGKCISYKEPYLLHQYSLAKRTGLEFENNMSNPTFLELSTKLLSRTFSPSEVPVIKPTDTCVNLSLELLEMIPGSKGILLYEKLDEFILSGLKKPTRRAYIRDMVQRAKMDLDKLGFSFVDTNSLNDAQAAAYVWLGMMHVYKSILENNSSLLKTVHSSDFLTHKLRVLLAVSEYFNLDLSEDELKNVCDGDLFKRDSKDQSSEFNKNAYKLETANTAALLEDEISEGVEWANSIQGDMRINEILPNALLF